MNASLEAIKDLRARTGAGVSSVKEALENSKDIDEAVQYLREKGLAKAAKRAGKEAQNGVMGVYVHNDNRLVVVVEVATETDFAARSEDLKKFANDIALHVAAMNPEYLNEESVPVDVLKSEREVAQKDIGGKPKDVADKIVEGRIQKFYKDTVLMHQQLFTDESKTIADYLNELVAKIGEKIEITRFVKMQIAKSAIACNLS